MGTSKSAKFNISNLFLLTLVWILMLPLVGVKAEDPAPTETIKVAQVGTSGGIPAIQASVQNASNTGTYSIVITNPKTQTTFTQTLNSSGKEVTFAITNFTENGTYPYTLQVNGLPILEGGINLVSTKRTPTFVAQLSGSDLTIDVSGGVDYSGQTIFFKSGSYSNSLALTGDSVQRAFANAKGLDSKMTFSTEKGALVTVDVKTVGGKTPTTPSNNSSNNSSSSNNQSATTTPPTTSGGGSSNTGAVNGTPPLTTQKPVQNTTATKNMTIKLNQKTFKLEETIVATVEIINTAYAGRSITVRLGADDNSTVALVDLNNLGKGSATFKVLVPQPSSKVISATAYSISGSQLDTVSANYAISNEKPGTATKDDGDFGSDTPSAKYVSLDLSELESKKALLSWYEARNLSKYATKVKVINTTTHDERNYAVYMPDGDAKIDLNLMYDGPGIYTWELYSGGKLIAKAPYSTPIGVDGAAAVSQNGLPVLKTLANKDVYLTELDGKNPDEVNGATIGEPIGVVPADDITGQPIEEPFSPQEEGNNKKVILIFLAIFIIIAGAVGFLLYRRHKLMAEEDENNTFKKYNPNELEENTSEDSTDFDEVD